MPGKTDRRARRRLLRHCSSQLPVPAPAGQWLCFPGGVPPADCHGGHHDGLQKCPTTPPNHRR